MTTKKYAPKLPLQLDENGDFVKITDSLENVRQKLRMLILTNPGEKIMEPEFGVGIRKYLFESTLGIINYHYTNNILDSINIEDLQTKIETEITNQAIKYANDIKIYKIETGIEEQTLTIGIFYNYKGILNDTLQISIGL